MERRSPQEEAQEPVEPDISPDGVDLSLIRWMLSLSPLERLEVLQDWADGVLALRNGRVAMKREELG